MPTCSRLKQRMRPLPVWRKCEAMDLGPKSSMVAFGTVEIREFSRELGVYDDLRNGLAIGWTYAQHDPIPVDNVEGTKESSSNGPRRNKVSGGVILPTSTSDRQAILKAFGYTSYEINRAEKERLQRLGYPVLRTNLRKLPSLVGSNVQRVFTIQSPKQNRSQ